MSGRMKMCQTHERFHLVVEDCPWCEPAEADIPTVRPVVDPVRWAARAADMFPGAVEAWRRSGEVDGYWSTVAEYAVRINKQLRSEGMVEPHAVRVHDIWDALNG